MEIKGLDADTYYLEETKAPDGFNKLKERKEVKMEGGNNTITMDGNVYKNGVQIVNKKGTELPSTGGMGAHGSLYRGRTPDSGCCRCSFTEKILP